MSGIAKALGIIVALSLLIRACGGKQFREWEAEQHKKAEVSKQDSSGQATSHTRPSNTSRSTTSFGPMRERGRGGPGADRAVQGLIDQGNYDSSTEKMIRDMMEDARKRDGKR